MKYLKFIPWAIIAILIILNYAGCIGKRIKETITVIELDTVYQARHDSFIVEIPIPVEKKVYIKVTEQTNLDSIQDVYHKRILDLQKSIVEYQNAIFDLEHETPPDKIVITANSYKDTFDTETYNLKVDIGVVGHLESFDYNLTQFEKKETCPECPKTKKNFVSLGMEVGFDGENEAKVGYGHKFVYAKAGYKLREYDFNNFTGELGFLLRF